MSLKLEGVTHRYGAGMPAVIADIDMEVPPGQIMAIVGPSGSGKTTLLAILGLLLEPWSGRLALDGEAVRGRDVARLRSEHYGWIFQTANTLPRRTVLDNAALGLLARGWEVEAAQRRAREALDVVGLASMADREAGTLSGGENQRLCIARALAPEPRFVLADEPTGQLDRRTSDEVVAALLRARTERTSVVIVTHDLSIAERCEVTLTIRDGRLQPAELAG